MLIQKQMRSGRKMLAAALALGLGAGLAGAQERVGGLSRAGEPEKAPSWERLVYQASGGFAAVLDRMTIRPDGSLMASREFLGRKQQVRAFVQPEEAAGLERAFLRWIEKKEKDPVRSEIWYEVLRKQGDERLAKGAGQADGFLARLQELHRKALAGELAGEGDLELALPYLPEGSLRGFTLHETRLITWHLDEDAQRIEDGRRELSRSERDRLKSALEVDGDTIVVPTEAEPGALRIFQVVHRSREEDRTRTPGEEEEEGEEEIQPVRIAPEESSREPVRLQVALRVMRG